MRYTKAFPAHHQHPHQQVANRINATSNGVCEEDAELIALLQVSPTEQDRPNGSSQFCPPLRFPPEFTEAEGCSAP